MRISNAEKILPKGIHQFTGITGITKGIARLQQLMEGFVELN